jgi:hypothetical protein
MSALPGALPYIRAEWNRRGAAVAATGPIWAHWAVAAVGLAEPALVGEESPDGVVFVVVQALRDEVNVAFVDGRRPSRLIGELMVDGDCPGFS